MRSATPISARIKGLPHLAGFALLACALLAACDKRQEISMAEGGDLPVVVDQAKRGSFRVEKRFTGTVLSRREVEVKVREGGTVSEVLLPKEGEAVKQGQLLLRLVSPELDLQVSAARSAYEQSRSPLERYEKLWSSGLVSALEYEEVKSRAENARYILQGAEIRKGNLEIKAPAGGMLSEQANLSPGELLSVGEVVCKIVDPSDCEVEVLVPESWDEKSGEVHEAFLELPGGGESALVPVSLSPGADPKRGGRVLRLRQSSQAALTPNSVLAVRLVTQAREQVLTVPVEALVKDDEAEIVYAGPAPGQQGKLKKLRVTRGVDDGRRAIIEAGLEEGSWVVVTSPGQSYNTYRNYSGVGR